MHRTITARHQASVHKPGTTPASLFKGLKGLEGLKLSGRQSRRQCRPRGTEPIGNCSTSPVTFCGEATSTVPFLFPLLLSPPNLLPSTLLPTLFLSSSLTSTIDTILRPSVWSFLPTEHNAYRTPLPDPLDDMGSIGIGLRSQVCPHPCNPRDANPPLNPVAD